ncbi:MAG: metallophosphoesterase family protein [Bacillota bacterium]
MIIGVLSDTHVPSRAKAIPKQVYSGFKKVDLILHAGDACEIHVLKELELVAPVKAVAGNMDGWDVKEKFPRRQIIDIGHFKVGLIHGDGATDSTLQRAMTAFAGDNVDCIVFGHSHQAYLQLHRNVLMFNPGSPTDKRRSKYFSYGLLKIGDSISGKIVYF